MQEIYKNEIPWKNMLSVGVHTLMLDPASFWQLTMPEFLELALWQKSHSNLNFSLLKAELLELVHKNQDFRV